MTKTDFLEPAVLWDKAANAWADLEHPLNIAGVYQDSQMWEWAAAVCEQVRQNAGREHIRTTLWSVSGLTHPQILPDAVQAASLADVIVVSVQATEELSPELCTWIDIWLPRRGRRGGALIAVIGEADQHSPPSYHAQEYLQAVARRGRLDFLPHVRGLLEQLPASFYSEQEMAVASASASVFGTNPSDDRNVNVRHWGLNE